jgi:hypothetical protein
MTRDGVRPAWLPSFVLLTLWWHASPTPYAANGTSFAARRLVSDGDNDLADVPGGLQMA